jgi:hypothetical protein
VSYAHAIVTDYFRRRNIPPDSHLDGLYQYEMTILRDTLDRLEVILDDEGIPRDTAERVIRCMLYGAPSPAAAEERMRRENEVAEQLNRMPAAIHFDMVPADVLEKLGIPPGARDDA